MAHTNAHAHAHAAHRLDPNTSFVTDLLAELKREKESHLGATSTNAPTSTAPTEPELDHKVLYENVNRFSKALGPIFAVHEQVVAVQLWHNPFQTGIILAIYLLAVWWSCLLFVAVVALLAALGFEKFRQRTDGAAAAAVATPAKQSLPARVKQGLFEAKDKARNVQNFLGDAADVVEKVVNLLNWSVPANTMVVVKVMGAALALLTVVPFWLLLPVAQLLLGVKLFVQTYIYHRFPALKLKHDRTLQFWQSLPTNRQLRAPQAPDDRPSHAVAAGFRPSAPPPPPPPPPLHAPANPAAPSTPAPSELRHRRPDQALGLASPITGPLAAPAPAPAPAPAQDDDARQLADDERAAAKSWNVVYVPKDISKSKNGRLLLTARHVVFRESQTSALEFRVALPDLQALERPSKLGLALPILIIATKGGETFRLSGIAMDEVRASIAAAAHL